jgi:predicted CXXCH cytochrome family protein
MMSQSLKSILRKATGTIAVLLVGAGIFAGEASAGIANTKHNLVGATSATRINSFSPTSGTGEICVFCHTPHGSDTTAAVPLWNRVLPEASTFTTYNSLGTSSLDGATAPVGSVSLACLSCHDGAQAMNVMINQPGSGGYNAAGGTLGGSWTGDNQSGGKLNVSTAITFIGKDLQNDHPIGIQYAGGPAAGKTIPAAGTDYTKSFFKDADFNTAKSTELNGKSVWWVDTEATGNGTREKTDMQLYTRTGATSINGKSGTDYAALKDGQGNDIVLAGAQPFVECASCHDPHSENTTFLRIANTNSAVCLACHIK